MNNQLVILIVSTLCGTSLIWFIYVQKLKSRIEKLVNNNQNINQNIDKEIIFRENQNIDKLNKEIIKLKHEIAEAKHYNYMEGYNKAKGEFFLSITPYQEESKIGKDGFIINDFHHVVNIGYKYQLYINNLPVLEPTIKWESKLEERKTMVDQEKIKSALKMVEENLFPVVAQSNGVLRLVSTVNKV